MACGARNRGTWGLGRVAELATSARPITMRRARPESNGDLERCAFSQRSPSGFHHTYWQPSLLSVDEIGFCPRVKDEANLLFQVSSYRYERGSIISTQTRASGREGR